MTTLKDVAQRAGCSLTTVSIIANGRGDEMHISSATQERVRALIEEMGYRPNRSAQFLRSRKPAHPVIAFYWPLDHRVNLLGIRLRNLHQVLEDSGTDCEIVVQTYACDHLKDYLGPLREERYSGAIIGGASERDMIELDKADLALPIVLMNLQSRRYSTVGVNHGNIGARLAALIQKKGYRECAIIRASEQYGGTTQRTASFLFNCRQLGIEIEPEWIFTSSADLAGGARATEEFCALTRRPSVLYYENDSMAQGGLYTLQHHGIRVPEDVELLCIGLREPEATQFLTPSISCIAIPSNVDKQAITLLLRLLEERPEEPVHVEMEPIVRLRESFTVPGMQ
ncbi:MAG: LacI family DNA-binding transcriptional regulator [Mogibacterium sp.]|nr:LacI family DNA-binding transcriptional regulator [Mogibacterium sp.]